MVGANGSGHSNGHANLGELRERLAMAERVVAVLDGDDLDHLQAWQARRDQADRALRAAEFEAQAKLADLHRSGMSALQISRFIRSHPGGPAAGAALFKELPR